MLVTGALGTLGREVMAALAGGGLEAVGLDREQLDVADRAAVYAAVDRYVPTVVIHLAARTDVDACELDREDAVAVNVGGTEHFAAACRRVDGLLIYVSTGGVFGGRGIDGPFHEFDQPLPANWYSVTKLAGEAAAARAPRHAVVRAGWIVGGGRNDHKFVGHMLRRIDRAEPLRAVSDRVGTLTFAPELARFLVAMVRSDVEGFWHFSSAGVVSRFDIARQVVRVLGATLPVEPVGHAAFPAPAPRGRSEAIVSVRPYGDLPRPSEWRAGLAAYLAGVGRNGAVGAAGAMGAAP